MTLLMLKKLNENAIVPKFMTAGSAGMDLYLIEDCIIPPLEVVKLPTGLSVAIPTGYEGTMRLRSSTGLKFPLIMPNGIGTIDSDYRGEMMVLLRNISPIEEVHLKRGERIAQLVISPILEVDILEVDKLPPTGRDVGGFGSTN